MAYSVIRPFCYTTGDEMSREYWDRFVLTEGTPPPKDRGGRPPVYLPVLEDMRKNIGPGKWVLLAHYESEFGARDAKRRAKNGDMQIPAGLWEFRAVRNQENETSDLYVRWFEDKEDG